MLCAIKESIFFISISTYSLSICSIFLFGWGTIHERVLRFTRGWCFKMLWTLPHAAERIKRDKRTNAKRVKIKTSFKNTAKRRELERRDHHKTFDGSSTQKPPIGNRRTRNMCVTGYVWLETPRDSSSILESALPQTGVRFCCVVRGACLTGHTLRRRRRGIKTALSMALSFLVDHKAHGRLCEGVRAIYIGPQWQWRERNGLEGA